MARSLATALRGVVAAADAIEKLWADRVRGLYIGPPTTVVSASQIRRRQASANLAARQRAASIKPEVQAALDALAERITLALALDVPAPISSADLESRLSEVLTRSENLIDNLADDAPHASRFREARDRVELLAVSLAIANDDDEGEDDDDSGDQVEQSGPPQPGSEFEHALCRELLDEEVPPIRP
jgi:hypothetical protein